jgi:hypothetical protein
MIEVMIEAMIEAMILEVMATNHEVTTMTGEDLVVLTVPGVVMTRVAAMILVVSTIPGGLTEMTEIQAMTGKITVRVLDVVVTIIVIGPTRIKTGGMIDVTICPRQGGL